MTKILFALGAAAVALSAAPTDAQYRHHARNCMKWRNGHCVSWMSNRHMGLHYMRSPAGYHRYRVGYVFGPDYGYTAFGTLPQPYVVRYNLSPDYRYVYRDNYIYVVDPTTYAITRILNAVPR